MNSPQDDFSNRIGQMKSGAQDQAPPAYIEKSPAKDQGGAFLRDALILASALPALIAVFGTHDLGQIVSYLQSTQFAPALGVLVLIGTSAWRQVVTRRKKKEVIAVANSEGTTPVLTSSEAKAEGLK
jgi:hypothetical protein